MSYSDWEFQRYYAPEMINLTPPQGNPNVHTALSSPLSDSGVYCRYFSGQVANTTANQGVMHRLKLNNPDYIDVSRDQAISLRAKVRIKSFSFSGAVAAAYHQSIGVHSYFANMLSEAGRTAISNLGYGLELRAFSNGSTEPSVKLVLSADPTTSNSSFTTNASIGYSSVADCSGTYILDTWYHIRLDVIPNGLTAAVLKGYTSSDNGASWSQVAEYYVEQTNARFRTVGNNGIIAYIALGTSDTQMYGVQPALYVDDFKINTELAI